ncbi:hypothetical protein LK07_04875 [Streptomyces pluripotens]|uniref:Carboxyltransferase domain-containing protein n=1 Tax=Streptomyces pluripotens TaxID=1355015 RepID=A0A221NU50_9ACTN|nr:MULTISPECIES: biotin-dependent carboxyltransferase family protein [Streptomyces]ASN23464.1 hypothetical protein LK07_04875 [Streptomyces pluripotens]MCH0555149.1 biotin-dependent carboxyltransferase family protein [Streptomyces sp. MUM 16J]
MRRRASQERKTASGPDPAAVAGLAPVHLDHPFQRVREVPGQQPFRLARASGPQAPQDPAVAGAPVAVPAGVRLEVGAATAGVRSYVAVSGGIATEPGLGSRATDLLSGLGPPPLNDGTLLPLGTPGPPPARVAGAPQPGPPIELVLRVTPGPRDDWFTARAVRNLLTHAYRVSAASNHIGLRTEGPALERARPGELPSEGVVLGAVQVPPDGRPVVFLADHPTTGGYPVVAVVRATDLPAAAQAVPGAPVRFLPVRRR